MFEIGCWGEFEIPKHLTRLKGMNRDAKCRAVNLLVAFTNFGPTSHSRLTRSQGQQNAICSPGLKDVPKKN